MATVWWLSFADPKRPRGEQFSGVAIVETEDIEDERLALAEALRTAWRTGCNPGGEVSSHRIPLDAMPDEARQALAEAPRHVLLSKADLQRLGLI